jgi:hypothetical protein
VVTLSLLGKVRAICATLTLTRVERDNVNTAAHQCLPCAIVHGVAEVSRLLSDDDDEYSADDTVNQLFRRGRAPIEEGTCVVFSNHQLVHRILTTLNSSDGVAANRDFVALFIIDQREPVGTTLQPEVPPSSPATHTGDKAAACAPKTTDPPYLTGDRSPTFADRDHRRRLRLFDQLTPKTSFTLDAEVNGQSA